MNTLDDLSRRLATEETSATALVDAALQRITDPAGEGSRVFISVAKETALAQANEIDRRRKAGAAVPQFAGIPITIKDLFDVAGEVTRAGSRVFAQHPPATEDAPAVARLRAAGFIFIGRANMTEFAYSGLGLNPHYGTPLNTFDRATRRIPGGSTSGGAVAVADGMAIASLGTDTGGSCRIPAAFNGIVGFKPTAHRVPREGAIPLSQTLDSVGPIALSAQCCATLDAILRGAQPSVLPDVPPRGLRLLLPTTLVLSDVDDVVAQTFAHALSQLSRAGVTIVEQPIEALGRIPQLNANGGFAAAEAYAWHRELLDRHGDLYDPRVANRILKGRDTTTADLERLRAERAAVIAAVADSMRGFDALVMPTVPIIPPPLAAFAEDSEYVRLNGLVLRNPALANFLDGCSISLPIHRPVGAPPVGLMLMGARDADEHLLRVAHGIDRALLVSR